MRNKNILAIAVLASLAWVSCYYDKESLLYPGGTACDTLGTISYTKTISPLFQQYCNSCHGGNSPSGGIPMGNHTADKALALNGKLYGSISHSNGYSPMPQGMSKMNSCQLATVKKWIDSGAPNN